MGSLPLFFALGTRLIMRSDVRFDAKYYKEVIRMITLLILFVLTIIAIIVTVLLLIAGAGVLCLLPVLSDVLLLIAAVKIIKDKKGDDK